MKKATKMSVADFEAVQSIPDWAVFSFDSYMKYVGHGTLSHSEFLEYHTDWLKLVVKLDTKIFGNRQSRSKSKSHAKNPFIEDEAVNYGADDCEENEYESEPEVCSSKQATKKRKRLKQKSSKQIEAEKPIKNRVPKRTHCLWSGSRYRRRKRDFRRRIQLQRERLELFIYALL